MNDTDGAPEPHPRSSTSGDLADSWLTLQVPGWLDGDPAARILEIIFRARGGRGDVHLTVRGMDYSSPDTGPKRVTIRVRIDELVRAAGTLQGFRCPVPEADTD